MSSLTVRFWLVLGRAIPRWGLAVSRAFGDLLLKEPQNYGCAQAPHPDCKCRIEPSYFASQLSLSRHPTARRECQHARIHVLLATRARIRIHADDGSNPGPRRLGHRRARVASGGAGPCSARLSARLVVVFMSVVVVGICEDWLSNHRANYMSI